jgi:copper chaperone CopZ
MSTVTYKVPNISCGHCVHTIENELGEMEGVVSVNADQNTRMVQIDFQPPADEGKIIDLLAEINYPIE